MVVEREKMVFLVHRMYFGHHRIWGFSVWRISRGPLWCASVWPVTLLPICQYRVSKCAHSLARHHHASWDPVPATNLNPRLVLVLTSCGPDVHSISATIAPLSFYTLVRRSRHFHLFGSIKSCYPRDPRLHFIHPSHLLSFLHFLCTRNSFHCFISSSSQFWTFQCKS